MRASVGVCVCERACVVEYPDHISCNRNCSTYSNTHTHKKIATWLLRTLVLGVENFFTSSEIENMQAAESFSADSAKVYVLLLPVKSIPFLLSLSLSISLLYNIAVELCQVQTKNIVSLALLCVCVCAVQQE